MRGIVLIVDDEKSMCEILDADGRGVASSTRAGTRWMAQTRKLSTFANIECCFGCRIKESVFRSDRRTNKASTEAIKPKPPARVGRPTGRSKEPSRICFGGIGRRAEKRRPEFPGCFFLESPGYLAGAEGVSFRVPKTESYNGMQGSIFES